MAGFTIYSPSEQVAAYLREELIRGRWTETMPGAPSLAADLGIDHKAVESALRMLEDDGLLVHQGQGRRRKIVLPDSLDSPSMRVAILSFDPLDITEGYIIDLQHQLTEAGHTTIFAMQHLAELGMDIRSIRRLVSKTVADAWIVCAGSHEVLEWFSTRQEPAFALFGRRRSLPIPGVGPDKPPAMTATTRRLIELGHRRIVLLARAVRRLPEPGAPERAFFKELKSQGISPSTYNLPDWEENIEGFHGILNSLFKHTPPTALIIEEAPFFAAAMQFCARQGIRVPEDVSLICTDGSPQFAWYRPSVAHIHWDSRPVVRRIVRWADNISRGRKDICQTLTKAEYVEGGTVGPAPKGR